MQELEGMTLQEMREFVQSNRKLRLEAENRPGLYGLIERVLKNQRYSKLKRGERGIVRRFLVRVSGLSRAQTARLIGQWLSGRQIRSRQPLRRRFLTTSLWALGRAKQNLKAPL
jgi:hypothetical protein